MRTMPRAVPALVVLVLAAGCGGGAGSSPATPSTPAPTPTPTPEPNGTIESLSASVPAGSTVVVAPMHVNGQQAPDLRFQAVVNLREDLALGLVQAFVRTDEHRCMGGGQGWLSFPAEVDIIVQPLSMSHQAMPPPPCQLPYTTTHVEFVVSNSNTREQVLVVNFPATYNFVAEP